MKIESSAIRGKVVSKCMRGLVNIGDDIEMSANGYIQHDRDMQRKIGKGR